MNIDVNALLSNSYVQLVLGVVGFILLVSLASRCTEPGESAIVSIPANTTNQVLHTVSTDKTNAEDRDLEVIVEAGANTGH